MTEQEIDPILAITIAIQMLDDISTSATRESIQATRDYVYSIEKLIPVDMTIALYSVITNIEILHEQLKYK